MGYQKNTGMKIYKIKLWKRLKIYYQQKMKYFVLTPKKSSKRKTIKNVLDLLMGSVGERPNMWTRRVHVR